MEPQWDQDMQKGQFLRVICSAKRICYLKSNLLGQSDLEKQNDLEKMREDDVLRIALAARQAASTSALHQRILL